MMGTKKVGAFSSPRKKAILIIIQKKQNARKILKFFFKKTANSFLTLSGNFYMNKARHDHASLKIGT
ncbi:MAG: hypothetical protein NTU60_05110 [Candidatus Aminicenantes bacterium]|nr:hypothetical protein [Candidatus Aminicenantes bacterium]